VILQNFREIAFYRKGLHGLHTKVVLQLF